MNNNIFNPEAKKAAIVYKLYSKRKYGGQFRYSQSKSLEKEFNISSEQVRELIHELRCMGDPANSRIGSDQNGYFWANKEEEIQHTVAQLTSRINKIRQARDGLVKSFEINNQTDLFISKDDEDSESNSEAPPF